MAAVPPGRAARPEDCVLSRADSTTIGTPCVLASERASHPGDERYSAEPSVGSLRQLSTGGAEMTFGLTKLARLLLVALTLLGASAGAARADGVADPEAPLELSSSASRSSRRRRSSRAPRSAASPASRTTIAGTSTTRSPTTR